MAPLITATHSNCRRLVFGLALAFVLLSGCSAAADVAGEAEDLPGSPREAARAVRGPGGGTEQALKDVVCQGLARARRGSPPSEDEWARLVARQVGEESPGEGARNAGRELERRFGDARGREARSLAVAAGCAIEPL